LEIANFEGAVDAGIAAWAGRGKAVQRLGWLAARAHRAEATVVMGWAA